jgi:hypothetical protein
MTPLKRRRPKKMDAIEKAFWIFHQDNPEVYSLCVALAREALAVGRRKIGMKMVWERARWDFYIRTTDDTYKLNNNYTALYARLIMKQESDLAGVFDLRSRKKTA